MAIISAGGRVPSNAFFPPQRQRPPAPSTLLSSRCSVKYPTPNAIANPGAEVNLRQVRVSKLRSDESPSLSSASSERHARSPVPSLPLHANRRPWRYPHTVLYNHRILEYGFVVCLVSACFNTFESETGYIGSFFSFSFFFSRIHLSFLCVVYLSINGLHSGMCQIIRCSRVLRRMQKMWRKWNYVLAESL